MSARNSIGFLFSLFLFSLALFGTSILLVSTDCFADAEAEALQARIDAGEAENDLEEARREARDAANLDGASAPEIGADIGRMSDDEASIEQDREREREAEERE